MSDRCQKIYHLSITEPTKTAPQADCPKSVLKFGHPLPTAWALDAQAVGRPAEQPLAVTFGINATF